MLNEYEWIISRATGIASVVLLTLIVVLGIMISGRRNPHASSPTVIMGMHRWLSLGMVVFLVVHVATAIAETYVSIDLISAVVPFTSEFSTFWVGLGTLAFDLVLVIVATSLARHRMKERTWKRVHWLAYAMWPLGVAHGFALGTSDQLALRAITSACGVIGAVAITWRLMWSNHDKERRSQVLAQEWS